MLHFGFKLNNFIDFNGFKSNLLILMHLLDFFRLNLLHFLIELFLPLLIQGLLIELNLVNFNFSLFLFSFLDHSFVSFCFSLLLEFFDLALSDLVLDTNLCLFVLQHLFNFIIFELQPESPFLVFVHNLL